MDTALITPTGRRAPPTVEPIYQRLATHYRGAIQAGSLVVGDRMPSLRSLMRQHEVSLGALAAVLPRGCCCSQAASMRSRCPACACSVPSRRWVDCCS